MESSESNGRDRDDKCSSWGSPCCFLYNSVQACFQCSDRHRTDEQEGRTDAQEYEIEGKWRSGRFRRPPSPPLSSGKGGQRN